MYRGVVWFRWEEPRTYRGDVGTAEIVVELQASQSKLGLHTIPALDPLFIQYSLGAFHSSHKTTICFPLRPVK